VPVRHPQIVQAARHYGTQVHTCVPFDPQSKGGTESTVRLAKPQFTDEVAGAVAGMVVGRDRMEGV
jgi:transposase